MRGGGIEGLFKLANRHQIFNVLHRLRMEPKKGRSEVTNILVRQNVAGNQPV